MSASSVGTQFTGTDCDAEDSQAAHMYLEVDVNGKSMQITSKNAFGDSVDYVKILATKSNTRFNDNLVSSEYIWVSSIELRNIQASSKYNVETIATVVVKDGQDGPIADTMIVASWKGFPGSAYATTDAFGVATLNKKSVTKMDEVEFVITKVSKKGYKYDPSYNTMTQASLLVARNEL